MYYMELICGTSEKLGYRLYGQKGVFYMSYVKIGSEGFIDIEEAVIYAEDSELKSAVIDVYNDFGALRL